jgi:cellulose synthase/poly-beta-1,6-N-acetylglucosamine synthase-like glycosyltransferase
MPAGISYEILVGNHCGPDATHREFDKFYNDIYNDCAHPPERLVIIDCAPAAGTVASVRNYLSHHAKGNVLLFLDSDTRLTDAWRCQMEKLWADKEAFDYRAYSTVPVLVGIGWGMPFVVRHWFRYIVAGRSDQLKKTGDEYMRGAHIMIGARQFFDVGGFDEHLATGEDVDLTLRLSGRGIDCIVSRDLCVVHDGYPQTIKGFFRREMWHGVGDFRDWETFCRSNVAVISVIFAAQMLAFVSATIVSWKAGLLAFGVLCAIPTLISYGKFSRLNLKERLMNVYMTSVYLTARAFSFFRRNQPGRV